MDLQLVFDGTRLVGDLSLQGPTLSLDAGLKTAVIVSLFTDRRAAIDDTLPSEPSPIASDPRADRRGWWGDFFQPSVLAELQASLGLGQVPSDRIGSRLWLLAREKQLPSVVQRAHDYAAEALQWLLDEKIAQSVEILAEISAPGVLGLLITITRPRGGQETHRFDIAWSQL